MIGLALLSLVLGANTVQVTPPELTLGSERGAELRVQVEDASGATVEITSSLGTVSPVQSLGNGQFRAQFQPPSEHHPAVALVLVEVKRGEAIDRQWVSIPLQASADLEVRTKPRAEVQVDVGALHVGPAQADARGRVRVRVVVPPGIPSAIVHSKDLAGNASVKRIPLDLRPYARVRAATSREAASWADENPLEIEAFAVDPSGAPLTEPRGLHAKALHGSVGRPHLTGNGTFAFTYRAPEVLRSAEDRITLTLIGGGPPVELPVTLRAGPPAKIAITLDRTRYLAGSGRRIGIQVQVTDAKGNPVASEVPTLTAEAGRITPTAHGFELEVPDAFAGRTQLEVRASVGKLTGAAQVALVPAAAVQATLTLDHGFAVAGKPIEGTLVLRDRFGNPTSDDGVSVLTPNGERAVIARSPEGTYRVRYTPGSSEPTGPMVLEVRGEGATLGRSTEVTVLEPPSGWGASGWLAMGGQTNFALARGGFSRLGLGLRLGRSSFEAIAEADLRLYAGFNTLLNGVAVHGTIHGFGAALGARYTRPIGVRWTLHGSAVLGMARIRSTLSGTGPLSTTSSSEIKTFPLLRLAAGPAYQMGRGSLFTDVTFESVTTSGHLSGNVGGLGLAVGYLYPF